MGGMCHGGVCGKCHGVTWLVVGLLVLANDNASHLLLERVYRLKLHTK